MAEIAPPSEPISETEPSDTEGLTRTANALPPAQRYDATPASGDGDDLVGEVADPQVIPLKRPWYTPTVVEVTCPARQAARWAADIGRSKSPLPCSTSRASPAERVDRPGQANGLRLGLCPRTS